MAAHRRKEPPLDKETFISAMGANHLSLVPGDYTGELRFVARLWGIRAVDLGDRREVKSFLEGGQ